MKKFIACFALVILLSVKATDAFSIDAFTIGAGYTDVSNPSLKGGHIDFGMLFFNNILYFQNNFMFRAGGANIKDASYSVFTLSDKIIFGRSLVSSFSLYTYIEGGVGVYGNEEKEFFKTPIAYSFGFGGGAELLYEDLGGIYFEVGYLGQKINLSYPVGGVIIQAGVRIFFYNRDRYIEWD